MPDSSAIFIRSRMPLLNSSMKALFSIAVLSLLAVSSTQAQEEISISAIMKGAMKGDDSLYNMVAEGKGSKDDAKRLLAYVEKLGALTPPRGDESSWKRKTDDLVKGAKAATYGTKAGQMALQRAGNCKSCHSAHKEEE